MRAAGITEIELVPGVCGVFEVTVEGALRFSQRALRRFPGDAEIASWHAA